MTTKQKFLTVYQVRYYPNAASYSNQVGFKARLVNLETAAKVIRRLKKSGIAAFKTKFKILAR